jgi:hypothetical protein
MKQLTRDTKKIKYRKQSYGHVANKGKKERNEEVCIRHLYPTATPFIQAQNAESTASKCKKIIRSAIHQLTECRQINT